MAFGDIGRQNIARRGNISRSAANLIDAGRLRRRGFEGLGASIRNLGGQLFSASQAERERAFRAGEAEKGRLFSREERLGGQEFQAGQQTERLAAQERMANARLAAERAARGRQKPGLISIFDDVLGILQQRGQGLGWQTDPATGQTFWVWSEENAEQMKAQFAGLISQERGLDPEDRAALISMMDDFINAMQFEPAATEEEQPEVTIGDPREFPPVSIFGSGREPGTPLREPQVATPRGRGGVVAAEEVGQDLPGAEFSHDIERKLANGAAQVLDTINSRMQIALGDERAQLEPLLAEVQNILERVALPIKMARRERIFFERRIEEIFRSITGQGLF